MRWACRPGLLALVGPQLGPQLAPSCNRESRERVGLQQPLPVEALAAGAEMQWPLQLVSLSRDGVGRGPRLTGSIKTLPDVTGGQVPEGPCPGQCQNQCRRGLHCCPVGLPGGC